jgi:asparagine synthase (glutamine-hydrolysing)
LGEFTVSVQGGLWNFDASPTDQDFLAKISQATIQYGPDGGDTYFKGPIGMFYRAFHTTKESRIEHQPYISHQGDVLTWDGRLDNREELTTALHTELDRHRGERTEAAIVMAAWEAWGIDFLRRLVGDFSLALWNSEAQTLTLAKDFIGPRHLYYQLTHERIFWCTHLEPMVLLAGRPFEINREYIAGYFDSFPGAHLTPYVGIDSVPPGAFVQIKNGRATTQIHWSFDPGKTIRYGTDAEYEEHFRAVFKQAVTRRLRSDSPVLSELSGGMDSSSIVCMADAVITEGKAETPRLDTISYYDDDEPNWDERPYFTKVEEKRGRTGTHINVGKFQDFKPLGGAYFVALPGASQKVLEFDTKRQACMETQGNRVVLSGIGGDEVMGGVPTPIPELADLLVQLHLRDLNKQLKAWSLIRKQPWLHLLVKALRMSEPMATIWSLFHQDRREPAPWLETAFVKRYRASSRRMNQQVHALNFLPSQRAFLCALSVLKDQFGCTRAPLEGRCEERYPYLDRDLVEFMISIPREQVMRPGQRRSLMRRSLVQLVPSEIIQRKRKAYVIRGILTALEEGWPVIQNLFQQPLSGRDGIIRPAQFSEAAQAAIHGDSKNVIDLQRTFELELWLRSLRDRGILNEACPIANLSDSDSRMKLSHRYRGVKRDRLKAVPTSDAIENG